MPRRSPRPRQTISTEVVPPAIPATPEEQPPPVPPTLSALRVVVDAIVNGTPLIEHRDLIERLIHSQENRAEMIDSLLLTHDYTRLLAFVSMQHKIEADLLESAQNNALSAAEKMALLRYCNEESKYLGTKVKAGSTSIKDIMGLLAKMDFATQVNEDALRKRLLTTTPQGREIIRRIGHRLSKLGRGQPDSSTVED